MSACVRLQSGVVALEAKRPQDLFGPWLRPAVHDFHLRRPVQVDHSLMATFRVRRHGTCYSSLGTTTKRVSCKKSPSPCELNALSLSCTHVHETNCELSALELGYTSRTSKASSSRSNLVVTTCKVDVILTAPKNVHVLMRMARAKPAARQHWRSLVSPRHMQHSTWYTVCST